ncbi:MAG: hypothetical protein J0M28_10760 [Thauera sp.]|nr:hypothetical protein [Thauera sp.]
MKTHPHIVFSWTRALLAFVVVCMMSGCGLVLTPIATLSAYGDAVKDDPQAFDDAFVQAIAEDFGLMALFAQVVYREDRKIGRGCGYLETGFDDTYGMPKSSDGTGRWMRWRGSNACVDDPGRGLFYETYVFRQGDAPPSEAVIAFRGTENTKDQFISDWTTNLSALFGFEPAQYALARSMMPDLIKGLRHANPEIVIHAVGHSLGGGLAQQAGYQFAEVTRVVTFNTSPVTNWTRLKFDGAVRNRYPLIYRIYHGGEILEKVRFITTSFTSTRYNRYDLGLQFDRKALVAGHSMRIVACMLARILDEGSDRHDAGHHYGREYIRKEVLGSRICQPDPAQSPPERS